MKKHDMKAIMTRTHEIRKSYRWTMSQALRSALIGAKNQVEMETRRNDAEFLFQMQDHHSNAEVAGHYYGTAA